MNSFSSEFYFHLQNELFLHLLIEKVYFLNKLSPHSCGARGQLPDIPGNQYVIFKFPDACYWNRDA